MTAFGWNVSHRTVHLITNKALRAPNAPPILGFAPWSESCTLNQKDLPRAFRWTLEVVQLVLLVVLPYGWWQTMYMEYGKNTQFIYAWMPTVWAYGAQVVLLTLLRVLDCELTAPDGQVRTCSGWEREVERITALVEEHKTLEPLSTEDTEKYYKQGRSNTTRLRLDLLTFAGYAVPVLSWLSAWAILAFLFYVLYRGITTTSGPYVRDAWSMIVPQSQPVSKVGIVM